MPVALSYPGVYIEEVASGVRTITGVPTSIAAFIGRATRGQVNKAITINGFGDFERIFGGLWLQSHLGFAVRDFFLNGGGQAIIVRLFAADLSEADVGKAAVAAKAVAITFVNDPEQTAAAPAARAGYEVGGLDLVAASEGLWGANLRVSVNKEGISKEVATAIGVEQDELFYLKVRDARAGGVTEKYANLTVKESARRIDRVLLAESALVQWSGTLDQNAVGPVTGASDPVSAAEGVVGVKKKALAAGTTLTTEQTVFEYGDQSGQCRQETGARRRLRRQTPESRPVPGHRRRSSEARAGVVLLIVRFRTPSRPSIHAGLRRGNPLQAAWMLDSLTPSSGRLDGGLLPGRTQVSTRRSHRAHDKQDDPVTRRLVRRTDPGDQRLVNIESRIGPTRRASSRWRGETGHITCTAPPPPIATTGGTSPFSGR